MRLARWTAVLVVWFAAAPMTADAHPVPFSYVDVRIRKSGMELDLRAHVVDWAHELNMTPARLLEQGVAADRAALMTKLLAARVKIVTDGVIVTPDWVFTDILDDNEALRFHASMPLSRPPGTLEIQTILFPYDPNHQTFVNVYEDDAFTSQAILDHNKSQFEYIAGTTQGALAAIRKFIPEGFHHILIGPDHILFLVGLLLLGGSLRKLFTIVTAFTLAHSVTLSLAALNIFTPPASLIEPAIALSIVYVGIDNLVGRGGRDVRHWIALAFGFIHGFGFANVLAEMGLPQRVLGWALFSFNFGVELGQLLVVSVVATAFAVLRSRSEVMRRRLVPVGSIAVSLAGVFWFVQRVFFSGGI